MPSILPVVRAVGTAARQMFDLMKTGRDASLALLPLEYEHLRPELQHAVNCALAAAQVQYILDWDSETYHDVTGTSDGRDPAKEAAFRQRFRPLDPGQIIDYPCTILDNTERVEAWYLPGAIQDHRQEEMERLMQEACPCLERNPPRAVDPSSPNRWRQNRIHFRKPEDCRKFAAGLFTASPGYQMRGHQSQGKRLSPSKDLATIGKPPTHAQRLLQAWVKAMAECALILSAILAVTHPEQFEANLRSLEELCQRPELFDIASQWAFAFNAVSVISNRCTPEHRDLCSGGRNYYDLLLSIGGCARTVLELLGLGLRLRYDSGTVALFSGHVHLHTASNSQKERFCIACYSRKEVHHEFGISLPRSVRMNTLF